MIHWKMSALSVAVGAAATLGLMWFGGRGRNRSRTLTGSLSGSENPAFDEELHAREAEKAARSDALYDLARERDDSLHELFDTTGVPTREVQPIEPLDLAEPVDVSSTEVEPLENDAVELGVLDEEPLSGDEPYDALDPESIGSEFLRRATESTVLESPPQGSLFEASSDVAVELPVGRVEADGHTELHEPRGRKPGETDLSPTEDELEQRRGDIEGRSSGKPDG